MKTKKSFPLSKVYQLIQTGPVVMVTTAQKGKQNIMAMSWHMMVEFEPLDHKAVYNVLKNICEKEKIKFKEEPLKQLARTSAGDLRGAVNDLQLLTQDKKKLKKEDLKELSERNKEETIINALLKIFKTKSAKSAMMTRFFVFMLPPRIRSRRSLLKRHPPLPEQLIVGL